MFIFILYKRLFLFAAFFMFVTSLASKSMISFFLAFFLMFGWPLTALAVCFCKFIESVTIGGNQGDQ